jgi:hypothetical protein
MTRFALVPLGQWPIPTSVGLERRQLLLGPISFPRIVDMIGEQIRIDRIKREPSRDNPPNYRYVVEIAVCPSIVDLWHNSRGGYRAQYLLSPACGEEANGYAFERLLPVVERCIERDAIRRRHWEKASQSIRHKSTRLWIHQGTWFRQRRCQDRILLVPQWQSHAESPCESIRKRVIWGSLIPGYEMRIEMKGQWLDGDGTPLIAPPKPKRAEDINQFGFT